MNMICESSNQTVTTGEGNGTCQCRRDMKWNKKVLECQILLDVDCSQFDYSSPVSDFVADAVERAEKRKNDTEIAKNEAAKALAKAKNEAAKAKKEAAEEA